MTDDVSPQLEFERFVIEVEPRLSRALVARFGREVGREATVDSLLYCWRHWDRLRVMDNPAGYLYRVGVTSVKPRRPDVTQFDPSPSDVPWVEPGLDAGLSMLTALQRTSVVLHHCFGWTHSEIAEVLGLSASTVRNHISRGMAKLRTALKVTANG